MADGLRRLAAAVLHRYPLYAGCGRIASRAPFRRLASRVDGEIVAARLRGGARLLVPPDDFVGRAVLYFGDLDPKVTWVCDRLLRPGDVMVDAGANLGLVSLAASARVGAEGRVHAFEPQPRLVRLLDASLRLNGRSNVTVHPVALGASEGQQTLRVPPHNLGAASLRLPAESGDAVDVPVRRLADCLDDTEAVRLVKLDVEGFEDAVVEGALPLFRRNPPDAVLFECSGPAPFWTRPVVERLSGLGYRFLAPRGRFLRPHFVPVPRDVQVPPAHDVLAVHEGACDEVRQALR